MLRSSLPLLLSFSKFYIVTQMHAERHWLGKLQIPAKHSIISIVVVLHQTMESMRPRLIFYSNTYAIVPIAKFISLRHLELSLWVVSSLCTKFYPLCIQLRFKLYIQHVLWMRSKSLLCRHACWVFVLFVCAAICRDNL